MFGATEYAVSVDVWSVGTILMELLLGHLPFQGQESTQQHLVEIMKLLGTPSDRDLQAMRATCCADDLPKLKAYPWERMFPAQTPAEAVDLAQRLLKYDPDQRLTASQVPNPAHTHAFLSCPGLDALSLHRVRVAHLVLGRRSLTRSSTASRLCLIAARRRAPQCRPLHHLSAPTARGQSAAPRSGSGGSTNSSASAEHSCTRKLRMLLSPICHRCHQQSARVLSRCDITRLA